MSRSALASLVLVVALAVSASAHHSPVMFDRTVAKTLVGTVIKFTWTNPHSAIQLDVPNESGGVDRWGVEMGSPQSMARAGWRSNIIKFGDTVTVVVNPLKSGEFGGICFAGVEADGGPAAGEVDLGVLYTGD